MKRIPLKICRSNYAPGGGIKKRAQSHYKNNKRSFIGHTYIEKLLKTAKQHSVNLYIVIPPYTREYKSYLPDYKELFLSIELFCKRNNIKLISFYNSVNYNDDDFYESDHLNLKGAEKFTKELKDIIRNG